MVNTCNILQENGSKLLQENGDRLLIENCVEVTQVAVTQGDPGGYARRERERAEQYAIAQATLALIEAEERKNRVAEQPAPEGIKPEVPPSQPEAKLPARLEAQSALGPLVLGISAEEAKLRQILADDEEAIIAILMVTLH